MPKKPRAVSEDSKLTQSSRGSKRKKLRNIIEGTDGPDEDTESTDRLDDVFTPSVNEREYTIQRGPGRPNREDPDGWVGIFDD